jgi:hypothetical protein
MHLNIDVRGAEDVPAKGHGPGHCVAWKIHGLLGYVRNDVIHIPLFKGTKESFRQNG